MENKKQKDGKSQGERKRERGGESSKNARGESVRVQTRLYIPYLYGLLDLGHLCVCFGP